MATKKKNLRAGMLAGMAAEKSRADTLDRFARAEAAIAKHPHGLLQAKGAETTPTFSAENEERSGGMAASSSASRWRNCTTTR
ncbi:hypothetical protein OJJOAM_003645 [Cupriavidus sp. H18C1]